MAVENRQYSILMVLAESPIMTCFVQQAKVLNCLLYAPLGWGHKDLALAFSTEFL